VKVPLDRYPFATTPATSEAILGLRPEHVGLADDGAAGLPVEAETLFMEPMGADTLGWFELAGMRISARLSPQRARTVAGRATLALDIANASLFDRTTEQRL
jgi:multiple sugar transport system ATP-binding protein